MKVAVIGGGPGGLATLKFLSTAHQFFNIAPIEARLFEAEDQIGGTFVLRVYEDAEVRNPCPEIVSFGTPSLTCLGAWHSLCRPSI